MGNNDGDRKKKKKSKHKDDNPSGPQAIRSYKVTEEPDGTLVCNCPEFRATGKVCTEILAFTVPESHKPPPAGNFTDNQKEGFVAGVNFTPEELDLAGLDQKRWNSVNYTLCHDEAIEMADLVEATSLTIGSAILVLGPSLDHEAEQLQGIDWLTSDAEPIDHTGAPAFPHQSVLKNTWLHSQSTSLKKILAFRYDPAHVHWLLFEIDLSTEEMICYEPLSQHGEALDMAGLVLIAKFFKPGRAGNKPQLDSIPFSYKVKCLDIQPDGVSCGFWMATTAFLIICGIPITKPIVTILRALKPVNIKEHWKWMLTAFRVEEQGLGRRSRQQFPTGLLGTALVRTSGAVWLGGPNGSRDSIQRYFNRTWTNTFVIPMIPQTTVPTCSQKRRFNQQRRRQVAPSWNPNTS
ncbi:hypothetical protein B0H14DRAFT_3905649, partial [Mycena olivaceomarginata]